MKEKDFQTQFGKENIIEGFFELKICNGRSLRWDAIKKHQEKALLTATRKGIYHKISDQPVSWTSNKTRFNLKKPFDCLFLHGDAYVVVMFYEPRKKKNVYYILIEDFIEARKKSNKKSFTEEEASEMAIYEDDYAKKGGAKTR